MWFSLIKRPLLLSNNMMHSMTVACLNHLPIRIQLHVPAFRTLYNQLKRPQQFSPDHLKRLSSEDENRIFTECWLEVCDDWDQFVTRNDSNILWSTFNKLAERFLCRRASIQDSKKVYGSRYISQICPAACSWYFTSNPARRFADHMPRTHVT